MSMTFYLSRNFREVNLKASQKEKEEKKQHMNPEINRIKFGFKGKLKMYLRGE
jgi:hypothetical protein